MAQVLGISYLNLPSRPATALPQSWDSYPLSPTFVRSFRILITATPRWTQTASFPPWTIRTEGCHVTSALSTAFFRTNTSIASSQHLRTGTPMINGLAGSGPLATQTPLAPNLYLYDYKLFASFVGSTLGVARRELSHLEIVLRTNKLCRI